MENIYVVSGATAIIVSALMQVAKNTPLVPWISRHSGKVNAWISVAIAFLSSVGIVATFDYNSSSGDFIGQFHGNVYDVWHVCLHTIGQWSAQQISYKGLIVPAETLGEIRAMLALRLTPPPISEGQAKDEKQP